MSAADISRLHWARESASKLTQIRISQSHSFMAVGGDFNSHHINLPIGLLTTWQLASLRVSHLRRKENECPRWKSQSLYNLNLRVTYQTNYGKMCPGLHKRVGIGRQGLLGAIMDAVEHTDRSAVQRESCYSSRSAGSLSHIADERSPISNLLAAGLFIIVCLGPTRLAGWDSLHFKNLEDVWTPYSGKRSEI